MLVRMTDELLPGRQVRTAHDLYQLWHQLFLMQGVHERCLYLIFFDADDRMLPLVIPIDDMPPAPDPTIITSLRQVTHDLADSGVRSMAVAIVRPGSRHMSNNDRAWARLLVQIDPARRWPVHLATPDEMHVFAVDDLMVA